MAVGCDSSRFVPGLQHVPEALCGDPQGSGRDSRETPVQGCNDAYKAAARIGESVRKLRIDRFISQAELSKLAGDWPAHLGRTEGDERAPHLITIIKIAKALGVDSSELVDEK